MKVFRNISAVKFMLFACMCLFYGCGGEKKTDATIAPRNAMEEALNAFYSNDFSSYVNMVDYGTELDSAERDVVLNIMSQYHERQSAKKGGVSRYEILSVDMPSDSLATVYYDLFFGNDSVEMCSEKMILRNGQWKIRVRGID